MSILIKDMEMPTKCTKCPIADISAEYYFCEKIDWFGEKRPSDCPLVEIPTPHGRLIDAKFVYEICGEKQGRASSIGEMQGISKVWKAVKRLPTVIEAEGSETDA